MLGAAFIAGADHVLAVGGAQAIAALAHGAGQVPPVDVIVGPGNQYVTAAKQLVSGLVKIDMLAGPSELLVVADEFADPAVVAADLLGQAEHDPEARPVLVALNAEGLVAQVEEELEKQLAVLPTADVARTSVQAHGRAFICANIDEAVEVTNRWAPEHLELLLAEPAPVAARLQHYGGLFIGDFSCEVLGDYGAGPNHTLPTGGTARSTGGLSVFTFLRIRTWMQSNKDTKSSGCLISDTVKLAELEGLHAHAASARLRLRAEDPSGASASEELQFTPEILGKARAYSISPPLSRANDELSLVLPKGRMFDQLLSLFQEIGGSMPIPQRGLRTTLSIPGLPPIPVKLLKPRNAVELIQSGARDFGFAGIDLLKEMSSTVVPYFNTKLDPVRIVLAAPKELLVEGKLPTNRHLVIATEYENIATEFIITKGMDASIRRSTGSTEVFPPEDADCIIDNTSTGTTLKENGMEITSTIFRSSTHLVVSPSLSPEKLELVDRVVLLLGSALNAREKVTIEFNVLEENLKECCRLSPCLNQPTVAPCLDADGLHGEKLYAVRVVGDKKQVPELIPDLKKAGAMGILVSKLNSVVA
jgi:ATP phosphoribosyltransferase